MSRGGYSREQSEARAQMEAMHKALSVLTDRKNRLMDKYLDSKIDQTTYEEQNERLGARLLRPRSRCGASKFSMSRLRSCLSSLTAFFVIRLDSGCELPWISGSDCKRFYSLPE